MPHPQFGKEHKKSKGKQGESECRVYFTAVASEYSYGVTPRTNTSNQRGIEARIITEMRTINGFN